MLRSSAMEAAVEDHVWSIDEIVNLWRHNDDNASCYQIPACGCRIQPQRHSTRYQTTSGAWRRTIFVGGLTSAQLRFYPRTARHLRQGRTSR